MTPQKPHQLQLRLTTLNQNIEDFLNAKSSRSDKTVAFYQLPLYQYRDHVGDHFWPPTDDTINSYLAAVRKRGCKQNTLNAYYRALRAWCNWLHKRNRLSHNPIELVEKHKRSRKIPRAPKAENLKALFETIKARDDWLARRDLAIFYLLLDTGLRIGEVVSLVLDDIDFDQYKIVSPACKTDERTVYFSPDLVPYLVEWLTLRDGLAVPPDLQNLFVSYYHNQWYALTDWGVRQALERWEQRAGIPHLRVHNLRHAYVIYKLRNGGELTDVQAQLGHKHLATTAIYTLSDGVGRGERHAETTSLKGLI